MNTSKDIDWDNAVWDEEKGEMVIPKKNSTAGVENSSENKRDDVTDINGTVLEDGDSVQTTKDLDIKGMPKVLKRGSIVKNIRLNENNTSVNCRIGKAKVQILTQYLKKA